MDKIIKKKWVKFLRKNIDKQIKTIINDNYGNCCVMGALIKVKHLKVIYPCYTSIDYLNLAESCGLNTKIWNKLANWNNNGRSFKWLASYIERYL